MKNMGAKARKVVIMVVMTGLKTSLMPVYAATMGGSPFSLRRTIFSATIMPSSTIIPITWIIAARAIISKYAPVIGRIKIIPNKVKVLKDKWNLSKVQGNSFKKQLLKKKKEFELNELVMKKIYQIYPNRNSNKIPLVNLEKELKDLEELNALALKFPNSKGIKRAIDIINQKIAKNEEIVEQSLSFEEIVEQSNKVFVENSIIFKSDNAISVSTFSQMPNVDLELNKPNPNALILSKFEGKEKNNATENCSSCIRATYCKKES